MNISSEHVTGFAVGLGTAALGFYLYKRNQNQIDQWLRQQGINIATAGSKIESDMTLEDLVREKERLEDLIAERELAVKEGNVVQA